MLRYILSTIHEIDGKPTKVIGHYVDGVDVVEDYTDDITGEKKQREYFQITENKEAIVNEYTKESTQEQIFASLDQELTVKSAEVIKPK